MHIILFVSGNYHNARSSIYWNLAKCLAPQSLNQAVSSWRVSPRLFAIKFPFLIFKKWTGDF